MDKEIIQAIISLVREGGEGAFWLGILYLSLEFLRPVLMLGMAVGGFVYVGKRVAVAIQALKDER